MQRTSEVIATVLGVEVMIIDEFCQLVAATGRIIPELGSDYGQGSITSQLLDPGWPQNDRYHMVDDPQNYSKCSGCARRENCHHLAVLIYPVRIDGKIIGTICLSATDTGQKTRLITDRAVLADFIDKISLLVAAAVKEQQVCEQLSVVNRELDVILNSVHDGIIVSDAEGHITLCNQSASDLLQMPAKDICGSSLCKLFGKLTLPGSGGPDLKVMSQEVTFCRSKNRALRFYSVITQICYPNGRNGFIVSFRPVKEIRTFASRLFADPPSVDLDDILTQDPEMLRIKSLLGKVAVTDATVLLRGESGTGKDLFARAIHTMSFRRDKPFVSINCGAIPDALLESELFGYEEGAFTGARKGGKPGKFELADGGTVFLDEIGDMPLNLQVKLLRFIEQRSVEKVGGTAPTRVDVRIIAATHRNLEEMIANKQFRADLYYRLSVIPVTIPPLRHRQGDLELLSQYLVVKYAERVGKRILGLDDEAMRLVRAYAWPGNVRELENALEYAVTMATGERIQVSDFPLGLQTMKPPSQSADNNKPVLKELEKTAIVEALEKFGTSVKGKEMAAKHLGISRATLYRRLKELEVGSGVIN